MLGTGSNEEGSVQERLRDFPCGTVVKNLPANAGDFPRGTAVENPPANAGDTGSSPGPGRSHMLQSN